MSRKISVVAISAALIFAMVDMADAMVQDASMFVTAALTGTATPCPTSVPGTPAATATVRPNQMAGRIAARYCVSLDEIEQWHDQGLGYGEIGKTYELAAASGVSVGELIARHQAGEGWGAIAHSLGLQVMGGGFNVRVRLRGISSLTPEAKGDADLSGQPAKRGERQPPPGSIKTPRGPDSAGQGQGNGNGNGGGNGNGNGRHGP